MELKYRDFVSQASGGFITTYEALPSILQRTNAWLSSESVKPISVETLFFPNIHTGGSPMTGS